MNLQKEIVFHVNERKYSVDCSTVTPETNLNTYLRNNLNLTGTKRMCMEGGCGTCIVTIKRINPVTCKPDIFAINSCLVSIFSCHSWYIYTIEGIGNSNIKHPIQNALIAFNGTQCGYCTPGMIMNMYALSEAKDVTMSEVENSFGGNICRCTGYRPILSAFKSICIDASTNLIGTYPPDIEDMKLCISKCEYQKTSTLMTKTLPFYYKLNNVSWIKVYTFYEIVQVMKTFHNVNYMFVAGNTAKGVYKPKRTPEIYVDILNVKELFHYEITSKKLILGANISMTSAMELFQRISKENKNYQYLEKLAHHIDLIANVPVRNIGSLAGNLIIKHKNKGFPSDIFIILEAVNAKLEIVDVHNKLITESLLKFLQLDMTGKIIKSIILSPLDENYKVESYKIMPRAQNAHALVNAAFMLKIEKNIIKQANLLYGCINEKFTHAFITEKFLIGKYIFDNTTLQKTFDVLNNELIMDHVLPDPEPEFRKQLAISLFYKFILSIAPTNLVNKRFISGGCKFNRPVSRGTQDYETNASLYPVSKPISKIEASAQTTGDAVFISDIPEYPNQLYAAFVLAKAAPHSKILKINPEKALKLEGVVAFYDANDIPGRNTFTPKEANLPVDEELFCSGIVKYFYQPVGVIVAKTDELAEKAADLVSIEYKLNEKGPLLTIHNILKSNAKEKITQDDIIKAKNRGTNVDRQISGTFNLNWQYHFHMETHVCLVVPTEDGFDMFPSTQWMDLSQVSASVVLGLPANSINVQVRRIGGAFGGKIVRHAQVSCATALAAFKLKQPVKMWLPLETNMNVIGKRFPLYSDYRVEVDNDGRIQYLNNDFYYDHGAGSGNESNEKVLFLLFETYLECYKTDTWNINAKIVNSDMHPGSYIRAPGSVEGIAMAEAMMEHIALELNIDPLKLRLNNIDPETNPELLKLIQDFQIWADLDNRKQAIKQFNRENCWRKKGLAVVPMVFPINIMFVYSVYMTIYQADGTVSISHSGVEIGQGVNTKVAQVCAYKFGIPMEKVSVKPSNNLVAPNSLPTGGSLTSEGVCFATIKACDILLSRMEPIKKKLNNPTWEDLVKKSASEYVNLSVSYLPHPDNPETGSYKVYGVGAAEVELDVLTGLHQITRVDILEDTGETISPQIDIGQVEGAFIMGLGYFLTEEIVTTPDGQLLTNRSWNYKPPGVKDIPIDFRIKFPRKLNPVGVLKSKATGEPPFCLAVSIPLAIRQAVADIRQEFDKTKSKWYPINGPSTVEDTFINCLHNYKNYTL